jgi:two-component system chemotaxis response regulator CheB
VYIGKGGFQMQVNNMHNLVISTNPPNELFKPSVNVMVNSVVSVYGGSAVGFIMTGMGNDGQSALKRLADAGGYVIAQEPSSCVVAGMPGAVIDKKICHEIQPLDKIGGTIAALFNK